MRGEALADAEMQMAPRDEAARNVDVAYPSDNDVDAQEEFPANPRGAPVPPRGGHEGNGKGPKSRGGHRGGSARLGRRTVSFPFAIFTIACLGVQVVK